MNKRRRQHGTDPSQCIQCLKVSSADLLAVCGDCEKNLCQKCAGEYKCDLCFENEPANNGIAHYSLCEACVVHCESCAGLSLCRFCKSEHLRSCDINIWTRTTLEIADEEIERKTTEIDAIHHSIHELQRQLSRAEEALNYAYELKMEAEEIVASLEQQERKSAIDVEEITTSLESAMDV